MQPKIILKDQLEVRIHSNRKLLGQEAAALISDEINRLLLHQPIVSIIFASAPSQNEFLHYLKSEKIDWSRIVAFHMDEYVGLPTTNEQSFGYYLNKNLFSFVQPKMIFYMNGIAEDPEAECRRYADLLADFPPDIVCLGIGENTHLAFNDPHVAFFNDPLRVKIVDLDQACRNQQVHDGCFSTVEEVPTHAITLTIPELMRVPFAVAIVPGSKKADAIKKTVYEEVQELYPSTRLRQHPQAKLLVDLDSAEFILSGDS